MMTAYRTLLHMRKWLNEKDEYEEKMKKLALPELPKEEAPAQPMSPASPGKRVTQKLPPPPTEEEIKEKERLEKEAQDKEMFGRYWIWDNYFAEPKRDLWQASA